MKQFDPIQPLPEKTTIVNQKQVDYEKKHLGTTRRYNGHIVFEINCTTGEISEAEFKEEKVVLVPETCLYTGATTGNTSVMVKDIDCKENCLYISALNKKSAQKKYFKWLIESKAEQIRHKK